MQLILILTDKYELGTPLSSFLVIDPRRSESAETLLIESTEAKPDHKCIL